MHAAPRSYTIQEEKKKVFKFCLEKQKGCTETVCSTLTGRVRTAAGALVLHPASQWAEISGMTGISIHSIKKRDQECLFRAHHFCSCNTKSLYHDLHFCLRWDSEFSDLVFIHTSIKYCTTEIHVSC